MTNLAQVQAAKRAYEDVRAEVDKWLRLEQITREWLEYVKQK